MVAGSFGLAAVGHANRRGDGPVDLGGLKITEQPNARLLLLGLDRALGGGPIRSVVAISNRYENSGRPDSDRKVSTSCLVTQ